jgi:hypothetical protein
VVGGTAWEEIVDYWVKRGEWIRNSKFTLLTGKLTMEQQNTMTSGLFEELSPTIKWYYLVS